MALNKTALPAKHLFNGFHKSLQPRQPARCMATTIQIPNSTLSQTYADAHLIAPPTQSASNDDIPSITRSTQIAVPFQPHQNPFLTSVHCTLHSFPTMEPTSVISYPSTHLGVPLRKDILHRAVIYEGDATRQGTANTKHRSEVRGSSRKIRPQKGTGMARLGDKKSPMLRGGGVAFGPSPRDFSTELPKRVYDLAWRMALSYRYQMGQLVLLENAAALDHIHAGSRERYLRHLLKYNGMDNSKGRSLFVTLHERKSLFAPLKEGIMGSHALAKDVEDVDVKDLLELGRLVIEKRALEAIFSRHESDLDRRLTLRASRLRTREDEESPSLELR